MRPTLNMYGFLSAILLFAGAVSTVSIDVARAQAIKIVDIEETVDGGKDGGKIVREALETIDENDVIYINITFMAGGGRSFTTGENCDGGNFGPLPHKDDQEFNFRPDEDDNHFLLSIFPGSKLRFPFNGVSCVYKAATPDDLFIRFSWFLRRYHPLHPYRQLFGAAPHQRFRRPSHGDAKANETMNAPRNHTLPATTVDQIHSDAFSENLLDPGRRVDCRVYGFRRFGYSYSISVRL